MPSKPNPFVKSATGVLLLNSRFQAIYYNEEAARILSWPKKLSTPPLDALLSADSKQSSPIMAEIVSGQRRYVCRAFALDSPSKADTRFAPTTVVLLERLQESFGIASFERFKFTSREGQTAALLTKGLTNKEIAAEMKVSPNTVKNFLKLVMTKVGTTNRTGTVSKLLQQTP